MLERFLRYVRVDTQSEEGSTTYPSTAKQLDLSRLLVGELREIGLDDVELTEHGYVFATLPGTPGAPVIGLDRARRHVARGARARASRRSSTRATRASRSCCPATRARCSTRRDEPALAARVGHDIVTSDGTTLLGADDKAGVAEIMTAVAYLREDAEPRATVRVAFTVDEEVGRGTDHFDLEAFGAECRLHARRLGHRRGRDRDVLGPPAEGDHRGRGVHPGTAKGKLVNAVKLAADFVAALPRDGLSPETTEGREGFVHPTPVAGGVEDAIVTLIVRDHDDELLEEHIELVRRLAAEIEEREPRAPRRDRDVGSVPEHARGDRRSTRRSSRPPRRRSAAPASSRCTRSSAAAPTAPA